MTDWERQNEARLEKEAAEQMPVPPGYPRETTLIAFEVRGQSSFRYYIDGASLSVQPKGIVRYVLLVRSPSGVDNVTYEAIRCPTAEYRVYALGRNDGTWGGRAGTWSPIAESRLLHHRVLQRDYFCPQSNAIADADEGRRALRQGGNPRATGFSGDDILRVPAR